MTQSVLLQIPAMPFAGDADRFPVPRGGVAVRADLTVPNHDCLFAEVAIAFAG